MKAKTVKQKTGGFWHIHHEWLAEYCYDYEARKYDIQHNKAESEQGLRLLLLQPIQTTGASLEMAKFLRDVAREADNDAAKEMWNRFFDEYSANGQKHRRELVRLHRKQCHPKCPWKQESSDLFDGNILTRYDEKKDRYVMKGEGKPSE